MRLDEDPEPKRCNPGRRHIVLRLPLQPVPPAGPTRLDSDHKEDSEPPGYRSYTYVFFGPPAQDAEGKTQQAARNRALLTAIKEVWRGNREERGSKRWRKPTCSASRLIRTTRARIRNRQLQSRLGNWYRGDADFWLKGGHRARLVGIRLLENDAGPFLATVLVPMRLEKEKKPILVTELTNTKPAQMKAVVKAYLPPPNQPGETGKSIEDSQFLPVLSQRLTKAGADSMLWIPQSH